MHPSLELITEEPQHSTTTVKPHTTQYKCLSCERDTARFLLGCHYVSECCGAAVTAHEVVV